MEFYAFHLMPWPYLDPDFRDHHPSAWVTLSNSFYDPEKGQELYARYIDELVWAEECGFDGICVNEHHQNAYGNMPSPNIIAAMLVQRTKRVKIAVLGNALPLRDHPVRVAEEVAMLDVISGGRIISGFVRGIGAEYYSMGVNPAHSRERWLEAHDLIVKSWTEPGPFAWDGKHYSLRYVNIWPKPLQKPHPPVWIPSMGRPRSATPISRRTLPWRRSRPSSSSTARRRARAATSHRPIRSAGRCRSTLARRTSRPRKKPGRTCTCSPTTCCTCPSRCSFRPTT